MTGRAEFRAMTDEKIEAMRQPEAATELAEVVRLDYASNFVAHEIVDRIETSTLRSYLLHAQRDGQLVNEFCCRVSVFNRRVSVVGDFNPIVFAYGPVDLRELITWMGERQTVDSYVAEKAAIGSGGCDKISRWNVEQAREDLLLRIDELRVEAEAASDDETWYADRCAELDRLLEIANKLPEYDDRLGCDLLAQQVYEALEGRAPRRGRAELVASHVIKSPHRALVR